MVGLSVGGMVAQSLAIRHPARVRRLALAGCPTLAAASERPRPPVIDADVITALVTAAFSDDVRREHPDVVAEMGFWAGIVSDSGTIPAHIRVAHATVPGPSQVAHLSPRRRRPAPR